MTAKIEQEAFDKGTILKLYGQFTGGLETDELEKLIKDVYNLKKQNLIIDFQETTYLSSIVIGIIVRTQAEFQKVGLSVVYCNFNKTLTDVLKMTKVYPVLYISEDLESAKLKFNN